jgi:hypothetical protein
VREHFGRAALLFFAAALATGIAYAEWKNDGTSQTTAPSGQGVSVYDGSAVRTQRGTADGYAYTYDRTTDDWQAQIALLNNAPVNKKWVSPVLDVRKFGRDRALLLKAPGSVSLYVMVEGMYSATGDSNSYFPFGLGRSRPSGVGGTQGPGYFLTVNRAVASDSATTAATRRYIPLVDSVSFAPMVCPYMRVNVWMDSSSTATSGVFLTLIGRPQ